MRFTTLLLVALATNFLPRAFAQTATAPTPVVNASMTAGESPAKSSNTSGNALGLGGLTKDRPKDAKTEITAEKEATFDNAAGLATFVGKVLVRDPQLTMSCDKLVITLNKDRKGMDKAEGFGNVVLVHDGQEKEKPVKSIGRCQHVIYHPDSGDLIMLVWPQVQQGVNNHISTDEETKMTLNRSGRLNTVGANKTIITDTSTLDQQPAASTSPKP
ncbi:MAG: LptA/OstA family protein [Chthoniobacterales bacterium]